VRFKPYVMLVLGWGAYAAAYARADESPPPPPEPAAATPVPPAAEGGADFSLHTLDGFIDLRTEYERNRVKVDSTRYFGPDPERRYTRLGFEESVGLRLGGWAIAPRTLSFDGELQFGLTQDRYREVTPAWSYTDEDSGRLLRYNLRANLLSDQKLSGSVYALRADDRISRAFQPSLRQQRTSFGTSWVYADDVLPMELSYDYLSLDRDGQSDRLNDEKTTDNTLRYRATWNIDDDHRLRLRFEHGTQRREYQGFNETFETRRDAAELRHELNFGPQKRHELITTLQWQEESGDFARDYLRAGPRLTLEHSDSLRTAYAYQYNVDRYDGYDVRMHRADWQLVHQVYSNLTTTIDVFGLREDVQQDVDTRQHGASIDWQYNRGNRWGRLNANLAFGFDRQDVRGGGGRRIVIDEALTLRDPINATLRNRDVVRSSILVTDLSGVRILRPGFDYVVVALGDTTRIARVATGRIADGDTILVDYQYDTPGDGEIDTIRSDFTIEQRFDNGLMPYYRLSFRHQEEDVSYGFGREDDRTNHHRLGVRYERDRFSLGGEYEIFDDRIEPFDGFHLDGRVEVFRDADQTVTGSSRFSRLFFDGDFDDRQVNLLNAELAWRRRLSRQASALARVAYRWEDDSVDGITKGWDATAGVEYTVGDLAGELTLEYNRLDLPGSVENDYGVFFQLRRSFPNVLARR
jgi:hypothetical protein